MFSGIMRLISKSKKSKSIHYFERRLCLLNLFHPNKNITSRKFSKLTKSMENTRNNQNLSVIDENLDEKINTHECSNLINIEDNDDFNQWVKKKNSMDQGLKKIKNELKKYGENPQYVYALKDNQFLIVMKKSCCTKTNEHLLNVYDQIYAMYEANDLIIVLEIDIYDPRIIYHYDQINQKHQCNKIYQSNKMDQSTYINTSFGDLLKIGRNRDGIRFLYYKSIEGAYFSQRPALNYTGYFTTYHQNGRIREYFKYINGKKNGLLIESWEDGRLMKRCNYRDDKMTGICFQWDRLFDYWAAYDGHEMYEYFYLHINQYIGGKKHGQCITICGESENVTSGYYQNDIASGLLMISKIDGFSIDFIQSHESEYNLSSFMESLKKNNYLCDKICHSYQSN